MPALRPLLLTVALAASLPAAAAGSPAFAPLLDSTVEQYRLPGIAMAVVENGEVVFTGTRGERGEAIDADTRFRIASNSKAMTAAVLARLVDRGQLAWDDPVIKHLPQFRMFDPWVTEHMQVRDLLIHNSGLGLGAGDLMLWPEPNQYTRADIIAGLAHLKPVTSFRSGYAYDNLMYVVAGEVAAAAGGKPIDQLLREEVFAPLGMAGCQAPAELTSLAAGGIRCSLRDMTAGCRCCWIQRSCPAGSATPSAARCGPRTCRCRWANASAPGTTRSSPPMATAGVCRTWMGSGRSRIPARCRAAIPRWRYCRTGRWAW